MKNLLRYPTAISLILGLTLVAGLSFASSLLSIRLTSVLAGDATAINISGSLRMQSYRIAYVIEQDAPLAELHKLLNDFADRLNSPELANQIPSNQPALAEQFARIQLGTKTMQDYALNDPSAYLSSVEGFVATIDQLVGLLEIWSENKVSQGRRQQMVISLVTLLCALIFALVIIKRVISPLQQLLDAVQQLARGERQVVSGYQAAGEFGQLSRTFDQMAQEITDVHLSLESKIFQQTKDLSRNNRILEFLFNLSRALSSERPPVHTLKQQVADDLQAIFQATSIYWIARDVFDDDAATVVIKCASDRSHLVCKITSPLEPWQRQTLTTVVDLFDNALTRMDATDNDSRIALLNERSSIARELHDSLAQSLSYLKIQVARWMTLRSRDASAATLDAIVLELRDGLNSTYRKLRELLVTFRSQTDEPGLLPSVKAAADEINRVSPNTKIHLYIDDDWPEDLSPSQEIHCLHVIREALTNVLKHARAENAVVSLKNKPSGLEICINDDGVGFGHERPKPDHFGLQIMTERALRIGGRIEYKSLQMGGAGVMLIFSPLPAVQSSLPTMPYPIQNGEPPL
ncbi:type IV pili methyl-accepting chemotaxis transducer N-terminal domain-containing protein [Reinekea sp.]|jgi:nitrate/nitrite-specific signal transduction histidine kinase|uniref:type IV pili methyl-accepting chemotaxis transducer N-terminal domain-containing protein n=1 Tax=Reinekea sp. TaxID=1970455 RepID=UPI002A7F213C|nr:type IV pili methyl-accepting chemotaxis transducer N-terminal domain-containing protein [Reinekea sp.]